MAFNFFFHFSYLRRGTGQRSPLNHNNCWKFPQSKHWFWAVKWSGGQTNKQPKNNFWSSNLNSKRRMIFPYRHVQSQPQNQDCVGTDSSGLPDSGLFLRSGPEWGPFLYCWPSTTEKSAVGHPMLGEKKNPRLYNKVSWETTELGQLSALLKLYR